MMKTECHPYAFHYNSIHWREPPTDDWDKIIKDGIDLSPLALAARMHSKYFEEDASGTSSRRTGQAQKTTDLGSASFDNNTRM